MSLLSLKPSSSTSWDAISLGEVMLRFDPGDIRIHSARTFQVWEAGAEYNVMRGLRRCFGLKTAMVTAMPDNSLGRLLEDLMLQGGVDLSHSLFLPYDGVGRTNRLGLNFTERGFGMRGGLGCNDRGNTAISSLRPGQIDWETIFGKKGVRWFHCGGIYPALGEQTTAVTLEAMKAAKAHGTIVSYDINYRPRLWQSIGGESKAREIHREIAPYVDVMIGNEGHFPSILEVAVEGVKEGQYSFDEPTLERVMQATFKKYPHFKVIAATRRTVHSASRNDWSGVLYAGSKLYRSRFYSQLEILDRIGGGDSFSAGILYGLMQGLDLQTTLEYGVAHGALSMTTPGDNSMAKLSDVEALAKGGDARTQR